MSYNHQLPTNAYYTEGGAISIRRSPKDAQIESLKERIIALEDLVNKMIQELHESRPSQFDRETQNS